MEEPVDLFWDLNVALFSKKVLIHGRNHNSFAGKHIQRQTVQADNTPIHLNSKTFFLEAMKSLDCVALGIKMVLDLPIPN